MEATDDRTLIELSHKAKQTTDKCAQQGYVPFNNVSRVASVLSQMFRHVREHHGLNLNLKDVVTRIPGTVVSYDQVEDRYCLAGSYYIAGWIHALGEICTDGNLNHANQQDVYAEAVQVLVAGLQGDKSQALAFIGGIELAKEGSL